MLRVSSGQARPSPCPLALLKSPPFRQLLACFLNKPTLQRTINILNNLHVNASDAQICCPTSAQPKLITCLPSSTNLSYMYGSPVLSRNNSFFHKVAMTLRQRPSFLSPQKPFLLCFQETVQYELSYQKHPDNKAVEPFLLPFMSVA